MSLTGIALRGPPLAAAATPATEITAASGRGGVPTADGGRALRGIRRLVRSGGPGAIIVVRAAAGSVGTGLRRTGAAVRGTGTGVRGTGTELRSRRGGQRAE